MNAFSRIKNLWKLSAYEPNEHRTDPLPIGTIVAPLIKKPTEKASFRPFIKKTPIEEINA
jgi:hypothetical protein